MTPQIHYPYGRTDGAIVLFDDGSTGKVVEPKICEVCSRPSFRDNHTARICGTCAAVADLAERKQVHWQSQRDTVYTHQQSFVRALNLK